MSDVRPEFADRREAGRRLAVALQYLAASHPLVLALPRGGVPVAAEVARALGADLDLLIVRKLGAPGHEELGIGALVDGAAPHLVLNEDIVRQLGPSPAYVREELQRQLTEIERRRRAYLGDAKAISPTGRTVIVIDDGIATGGTIRAALGEFAKPGRRGSCWRCRSLLPKRSRRCGLCATKSSVCTSRSRSTRSARITSGSSRPVMPRWCAC
jgi:putative phosphoribosyl transferase